MLTGAPSLQLVLLFLVALFGMACAAYGLHALADVLMASLAERRRASLASQKWWDQYHARYLRAVDVPDDEVPF